jgi:hypothetical protein
MDPTVMDPTVMDPTVMDPTVMDPTVMDPTVMDPTLRYEVNGEYVERVIDGETVLVPVRSNVTDLESVFTLNPVGTVIWRSICQGHNLAESVAAVVEEFEVDEKTAESDTRAFLEQLLTRELIQPAARDTP